MTGGAAGRAYAEAVPASAGFDPAGTGPEIESLFPGTSGSPADWD